MDFARLHARHLETRLNKTFGKGALVGSEIEDVYFYPINAPKIGGFVPSAPLRFFSFFALHWVLLWLGLAGFALWRLFPTMGPCGWDFLVLLAVWGGLNFGANDFGSLMMEENVVSSAGTSFRLSLEEMRRLIREAGYEARQRNNRYELVGPAEAILTA